MTVSAASRDSPALNALFGEVYSQLRRLARRQRAGGQDTLNTTALVHELYVQMSRGAASPEFAEPRCFYAYAAQAMRHLLVDRARARARFKRGGDLHQVELTDGSRDAAAVSPEQALQLDVALDRLAQEDPRAAEVVELHYFAGLPVGKIAELLDLSARTVDRDWRFARAFLHAHVDG